ncbi:MAG: ABC transporter ATP-binding protein [bacterium]|nr:ABC transporter ATP-binding protein [bacterium]
MESEIITRKAVRQVLLDYWRQYKEYPLHTGIGFLMPAMGDVLVFFVPPLIMASIIDIFARQGQISLHMVWGHLLILSGLWLLGEVFWRIGLYFIVKLQERGINALSKLAFTRLIERDYAFYANNFVGSLTKKALAFGRGFEMFTDTLVFRVTANILSILFVTIILWQYSPWIPVALLLWIAGAIFVAIPFMRRRSHLVALRHNASSKVAGRLSDSMTNMLAMKSFGKESAESTTFGTYVDTFTRNFKRAADFQNLRFDVVLAPIFVAANVCGLVLAIFFAEKFALPPGAIVVIFSYYFLVTRMFWEINRTYRNIESAISEAAELTQLFIHPPIVKDAPGARALNVKSAGIQYNNVTFKYNDAHSSESSFLNNFSLDIKPNEKVGLVGPSGGGKTTITKLLLRFSDVQKGTITIDGQDISKVTQVSLRNQLAYVPQEPLLFHRTLFENIAYGADKASKKDVMRAAKLAHADEFIEKLPQKYKTFVGERGIKLSGGQRQRIAIARALLKEAPTLVLDEATSSLDSESEQYIQSGLLELMKEKTALVIAHRLSTIKHLDRIIVLDQGKIVQEGTHEQLIKKKGLYAKLWRHQSGGFLED